VPRFLRLPDTLLTAGDAVRQAKQPANLTYSLTAEVGIF